jgi:ABC-2 type transport system permease protein
VLFVRTPLWVMNGLLPGLIAPFAVVMPLFAQWGMSEALAQLRAPSAQLYAGLVLAALFTFMGSVNTIASTAVSREGKRYWISRTMPQDPSRQVQAKLAVSGLLLGLSMLPSVLAYVVILRPAALGIAAPIAMGILGASSGMAVGLRIDMSRPMLRWDDPQDPVKRNLNAIFPIGFAIAYVAVGAMLVRDWTRAAWTPARIYAFALVISGIVAALSLAGLRSAAGAAHERIEQ